jgi:hypothetical protein
MKAPSFFVRFYEFFNNGFENAAAGDNNMNVLVRLEVFITLGMSKVLFFPANFKINFYNDKDCSQHICRKLININELLKINNMN